MTRKFRLALAAIALATSGAAQAEFIDLGEVTAPQNVLFGNSWESPPETFADQFAFSLTNSANVYGFTIEDRWGWSRTNVQLLFLASGTGFDFDWTPGLFSFSGLTAGAYSLFVSGTTRGMDTGYGGLMHFVAQPTRVPEPSTLALLGLGLICLGFMRRRTKA